MRGESDVPIYREKSVGPARSPFLSTLRPARGVEPSGEAAIKACGAATLRSVAGMLPSRQVMGARGACPSHFTLSFHHFP